MEVDISIFSSSTSYFFSFLASLTSKMPPLALPYVQLPGCTLVYTCIGHTQTHKIQLPECNLNMIILNMLYLCYSTCWNSFPAILLQKNGIHSSGFWALLCRLKGQVLIRHNRLIWCPHYCGEHVDFINGSQSLLAFTQWPLVTKYNGVQTTLYHCTRLHH